MFAAPEPLPAATPDPYRAANAQQLANISVAIASNVLQNADEDTPQGSVRYTTDRTYTLSDPQYDSTGALVGTTSRLIPIFKKTTTLTTKSQQVFDQQQDLAIKMNNFAADQVDNLTSRLALPFSLDGLPANAAHPSAPTLDTTLAAPRAFTTSIGGSNYETAKQAVIDAIKSRLDYQYEIDRSALVARLANQGLFPGMEAYDREIALLTFKINDGYKQAILAGGQEHSRLFEIERQAAEFFNTTVRQEVTQAILILDFKNKASLQTYQVLHEIALFQNTFRERGLQEALLLRNQPLNEVLTLKNGGQMAMPQFAQFHGSAVANTPIGQYVYQSAGLEMQAFQMKVQQQQALMGGIAGIAGAALGLDVKGGGTVGGNLLGKALGM